MQQHAGKFVITKQQNHDFACLSGDFNPLHVDPVYSRRLQFGRPVIHGIHHMLRTWDEVLAQLPDFDQNRLTVITATFPNPASVGQTINYISEFSTDNNELAITAYCNDKTILSLRLGFAKKSGARQNGQIINSCPPQEKPIDQSFPPDHDQGCCDLFLDASLSEKIFPTLSTIFESSQISQILASTRVVGMKCPGLHSIFSRISLEFPIDKREEIPSQLDYFEEHKDKRVQIMKIGVKSSDMNGCLDTFFRPTPVAQPSYHEICDKVKNNEFSDQRALIIGGSRGAGEATAKILAAGGAEIIITYNNGRGESENIQNEIISASGQCSIMELNASELATQTAYLFENELPPTHVYYFASPHIQANRSKHWDTDLYQNFCRFYVDAYAGIVNLYASAAAETEKSICFFYPSTVYIDQPAKGYAEYAVAKAAGETVGLQLAKRFVNSRFVTPRLARMSTDQTSSIIPIKSESTFDEMYKALKQ